MATIRYFIPEDGDTEESPNVFLMQKDSTSNLSPKLREIQAAFPLPGTYHFRFKCPLIPGTDREKGAVSVWMDCVDPEQHVGVWRNSIFAKVTRISMEDDEEEFMGHHQPSQVIQQQQHSQKPPVQPQQRVSPISHNSVSAPAPAAADMNLLGVFDASDSHTSSVGVSEGDLLGAGGGVSQHSSYPSEASLLDMNGPATNHGGMSNSIHSDFLGLNATPMSTPPVSGNAPVSMHQQHHMNMNNMNGGAPVRTNAPSNAFNSSTSFHSDGPFGGLNW